MDYHEQSLFARNDIQFPRLLAEIAYVGLTDEQMEALSESMDLEESYICDILDRATREFDSIKQNL